MKLRLVEYICWPLKKYLSLLFRKKQIQLKRLFKTVPICLCNILFKHIVKNVQFSPYSSSLWIKNVVTFSVHNAVLCRICYCTFISIFAFKSSNDCCLNFSIAFDVLFNLCKSLRVVSNSSYNRFAWWEFLTCFNFEDSKKFVRFRNYLPTKVWIGIFGVRYNLINCCFELLNITFAFKMIVNSFNCIRTNFCFTPELLWFIWIMDMGVFVAYIWFGGEPCLFFYKRTEIINIFKTTFFRNLGNCVVIWF